MIQGTYYKEWSRVLGREMEFKVYGTAGVPVLALPARGGRFYDWENNGMPDAVASLLNTGKVQLLTGELAARIRELNGDADAPLWCVGVDTGAVQAVNCRLRRPEVFAGAIGLSGLYDVCRFLGSAEDDLVLRNAPLAYLPEGIADAKAFAKAEENHLLLCAGQGGYEEDAQADTRALAAALAAASIPAHCEIWGSDVSHDWYWWGKELNIFAERVFGRGQEKTHA